MMTANPGDLLPGKVRRAFVDIAHGQIHCRLAEGAAPQEPPLLMLHGGPGSSTGLLPMIKALAERGIGVIAPDLMGNGASDPPPHTPDMAFYAECLVLTLDQLGVAQADVYGHHAGAQIACELAIRAPDRVRRLVLDGVGLFPPEQRRAFLERYAPAIEPDPDGGHLQWLWAFLSNTTVRFPHYSEDERDRMVGRTPPPPPVLTDLFAEVSRNWRTYHLSYRASFAEDFSAHLPLVRQSVVVLDVAGDPLAPYAAKAAALLQDGCVRSVSRVDRPCALASIIGAV